MRKLLPGICFGLALAALAGQADTTADKRPVNEEMQKPRWQVGQRWIVETTSTPRQTSDAEEPKPGKPVQWLFKVSKREKVSGKDCFRVEITCEGVEDAPKTTIWVDEKSLALRQIETGVTVQGEVRTVRERFEFDKGTSPVIGPLSALPLDLPLFSTVRPRSGKFGYKSVSLDADDKPTDDAPFAIEVEQQFGPAKLAEARGLLRESGDAKPVSTFEVRLKSPEREVRQLWRPGMPWPSYSNNGNTTARLIKVMPAAGGR